MLIKNPKNRQLAKVQPLWSVLTRDPATENIVWVYIAMSVFYNKSVYVCCLFHMTDPNCSDLRRYGVDNGYTFCPIVAIAAGLWGHGGHAAAPVGRRSRADWWSVCRGPPPGRWRRYQTPGVHSRPSHASRAATTPAALHSGAQKPGHRWGCAELDWLGVRTERDDISFTWSQNKEGLDLSGLR